MDANRFNQILLVDSIPAGELNTAKRLLDDLRVNAVAYAPSPALKYVRVESGDALLQCIDGTIEAAKSDDVIPMLHIECHGDEDGFALADGTFFDWDELKEPLTRLNVACRLNLLIAVAACTGGALGKIVRMSDRAPFWGLIGPTRTLSAGELEKAYRALYVTLISTRSPSEAVNAMDACTSQGSFWRTTAQRLFGEGWSRYKRIHCTQEALELRAHRMRDQLSHIPEHMRPSIDELKNRLLMHEPIAHHRFHRTFFMHDLYPEHSVRFPFDPAQQTAA
jgi:hypothetical protein